MDSTYDLGRTGTDGTPWQTADGYAGGAACQQVGWPGRGLMTRQEDVVLDASRPWTVKDVAYFLGCSSRHAYQLARDGLLPGRKVGGRWYFDPAKVRAYAGIGA